MSDTSVITREDLMAVGYEIYKALYEKDTEPLSQEAFEANCRKAFKEFSDK